MSGKGSHARPFSIPYEEYADRWDNIFKKNKNPIEKKTESQQCNYCNGTGSVDKDWQIFTCPFCDGTGKQNYDV